MFKQLLQWILDNCIINFKFGKHDYAVGGDFGNDFFLFIVNFGFWMIIAFFLCFFISLFKWCVRKCLRK